MADRSNPMAGLRIAFLEPYFGGSHRAFAEGFAATSAHEVSLFTHSASFWKWRIHGGFLTLAAEFRDSVDEGGRFDVVLATSMLDLARFVGVARTALGDASVVLYMHENQLTYPATPRDEFELTYAMANWASMSVADLILFNSPFHKSEWFAALPRFLGSLPDRRHTGFIGDVESRSEVLPVGVDLARLGEAKPAPGDRPLLLWNQRWEHDKAPELFTAAVLAVADMGIAFDVALAGERFVSDPTGFAALRDALGDRIVHYGYADEPEYTDILRRSDIVVSTARQEFFGISITEAIYAGAFPLLPDALVYPERLPESHHDRCLYRGHADLATKLTWALENPVDASLMAADLRPVMAQFDWSVVGPLLDQRLELLVAGQTPP